MSREIPLAVAAELEALLPEASKAQAILSELQSALREKEGSDSSDYTHSRAQALWLLAKKMQTHLLALRSDSVTYSDKAVSLSGVADSYLKLVHAFKTDPKMWSLAQSELVPALTQVSDEETIDQALSILDSHLKTYLFSLESWLGK